MLSADSEYKPLHLETHLTTKEGIFDRLQLNQAIYRDYGSKDFRGKQIEPSRLLGNKYRGLKFYRPVISDIKAPISHIQTKSRLKYQPYANSFTSVSTLISTPETSFTTKRKRKGKRPTSTMYCNHCKQGF